MTEQHSRSSLGSGELLLHPPAFRLLQRLADRPRRHVRGRDVSGRRDGGAFRAGCVGTFGVLAALLAIVLAVVAFPVLLGIVASQGGAVVLGLLVVAAVVAWARHNHRQDGGEK